MSQVDKEELSYEIPSPEILSSDFLVSRRGKIPSIIGKETTELTHVKRKENYRIEFSGVIFVDHVSIDTGDNSKQSELQLSLTDVAGKTKQSDTPYKIDGSDRTIYDFKCFTNNLTVKNVNLLQSEPVKSFQIHFHSLDGLSKISEIYTDFWDEYDTLRGEIKDEKEKISTQVQKLASDKKTFDDYKSGKTEELKSLELGVTDKSTALEKIIAELDSTTKKLEVQKASLEDIRQKETVSENNAQKLKQDTAQLNVDISNLETELAKLRRRKDLYAEDMENYVGESNRQLWFYYILSGVCVFGILGIAGYPIFKLDGLVKELVDASKVNSSITAWDFFIMRAPYATVCITIIGALITFIVKLFEKIFLIQAQRREIISLSVLARDISQSSSHGLAELVEEDIYKLREEAKFKLLSQSIVGNAFRGASEMHKEQTPKPAAKLQ